MLDYNDLFDYQKRVIAAILADPKASMLWLDMSMGKTPIVLTALLTLIYQFRIHRVLVLAPRIVAETVWHKEAAKWCHLEGAKVSILRGKTRDLRLCQTGSNFHVCNYESIPWLVDAVDRYFLRRGKPPPWDAVVFDEVDRFKNASGVRFQDFRRLLAPSGGGTWFPVRIGMTGTPGENGYLDLHGQYLAVDDGARLFENVGDFRQQWFSTKVRDYGATYVLRKGAKEDMQDRVRDITHSLSADDYLDLPPVLNEDRWVDLPPKVRAAYDDLENSLWAMIDAGDTSAFGVDGESDADADRVGDGAASPLEIRAKSAAGARTKCRQIANGALKGLVDTDFQAIHDRKLQELDRIMHEANGRPVLLAYAFRADMHRIMARYSKEYRCAYIGPGTKDASAILDGWTRGDYHMLVSHPASIGHGVDGLQTTCNEMVWFGLTDNLRWYRQFGARIRRLGQPQNVVHVRHIVARNTVDEAIAALLTLKDVTATELRQALSDYRRHKRS